MTLSNPSSPSSSRQLEFVCHNALDTKTLYVFQEPTAGEDEDFTGERLWFGALTMISNVITASWSELLSVCLNATQASAQTDPSIRVLELGCGAGVLGSVIGLLSIQQQSSPIKSITLTDGNSIMIRTTQHNLEHNGLADICQACPLMFGHRSGNEAAAVQGQFELIVGSDILYTNSVRPPLSSPAPLLD